MPHVPSGGRETPGWGRKSLLEPARRMRDCRVGVVEGNWEPREKKRF